MVESGIRRVAQRQRCRQRREDESHRRTNVDVEARPEYACRVCELIWRCLSFGASGGVIVHVVRRGEAHERLIIPIVVDLFLLRNYKGTTLPWQRQ